MRIGGREGSIEGRVSEDGQTPLHPRRAPLRKLDVPSFSSLLRLPSLPMVMVGQRRRQMHPVDCVGAPESGLVATAKAHARWLSRTTL